MKASCSGFPAGSLHVALSESGEPRICSGRGVPLPPPTTPLFGLDILRIVETNSQSVKLARQLHSLDRVFHKNFTRIPPFPSSCRSLGVVCQHRRQTMNQYRLPIGGPSNNSATSLSKIEN